jgi:hypothetical protein
MLTRRPGRSRTVDIDRRAQVAPRFGAHLGCRHPIDTPPLRQRRAALRWHTCECPVRRPKQKSPRPICPCQQRSAPPWPGPAGRQPAGCHRGTHERTKTVSRSGQTKAMHRPPTAGPLPFRPRRLAYATAPGAGRLLLPSRRLRPHKHRAHKHATSPEWVGGGEPPSHTNSIRYDRGGRESPAGARWRGPRRHDDAQAQQSGRIFSGGHAFVERSRAVGAVDFLPAGS